MHIHRSYDGVVRKQDILKGKLLMYVMHPIVNDLLLKKKINKFSILTSQ